VRSDPSLLAFPGRLPLAGGAPVLDGKDVVGGVGCSGGDPDEDLAVCQAMLDALPG
jgi:glc operon protein GlcG